VITTQWHEEAKRTKALLDQMARDAETSTGDELLRLSDQAINFVIYQTLTDPENEAKIKTLQLPKRSISHYSCRIINDRVFPTTFKKIWHVLIGDVQHN